MDREIKAKAEKFKAALKECMEEGMTFEEADHFLTNPVSVVGLQLPPEKALDKLESIASIARFQGPLRFYVMVAQDRVEELKAIASDDGQKEIIDDRNFDLEDMLQGKDPIGAAAKVINRGYSGAEKTAKGKLN
jgi:hypothetical protein